MPTPMTIISFFAACSPKDRIAGGLSGITDSDYSPAFLYGFRTVPEPGDIHDR